VLGGSRRRLHGIDLGYVFLDASHLKHHANAAAKPVLAACASIPAASRCSSAWMPQRPGLRTPGPVPADLGERGLACRCWASPTGQPG